jgi:RNA-binding protein
VELTGKQKRMLRALGQRLRATVVIGKAGLTDSVAAELADQFAHHELIKVKLPAGDIRKTLAADAARTANATCVGLVGRTCLLYRPNDALPRDQRVHLPRAET